jgi:uncharacterized protein
LLPRALSLLSTRAEGERLVPHYLTERDEPWLRALLDEHARFVGRKRSELEERLREPLPVPAPKFKLRMATHVLDALSRDRASACVPPRDARWLVFRAAAMTTEPRDRVLECVAKSLGVAATDLESALFADLRGERRVAELAKDLSPSRLALQTNQAIVASLLRRAVHVRVRAWGNTRALVRHARLLGLICVISRQPSGRKGAALTPLPNGAGKEPLEGVALDVSGPFALFRRTEVYGRALASLVPRAAWCNRFEIEAACLLGRGAHTTKLIVRTGDPIGAGRELRRHDSRVEERFFKDFRRAAPEWDVIREPRPLEAAGTLLFPDFELVHRRDPERRWLLEIIGFWTQQYLDEKLRRLRAAGFDRLILCIDESRCCSEGDLPANAKIIRFQKRIDPRAVLALVAGS